jgi:hypothetical protein
MGSFDGAESCELAMVGFFLLHLITLKHGNKFGLYRDDGLGIIKATPRQIELIKKDLCALFDNLHGLKITIENYYLDKLYYIIIINNYIIIYIENYYLDVTLNLTTGKYHPYSKSNNTPLYVHSKSNHPPSVLRNIPLSINKRLTDISSDQDSFEHASPSYQQAFDKSGYNHKLYSLNTP